MLAAGRRLGEDVRLVARVTLCERVVLGARVLVQPGAVLGADGFGFAPERGAWVKVPQLGGVRVGADVEIGANTTIDRGAIGDTIVEEGVKLDNQIQIAHNVRIGAHTVMAACMGVSGSVTIGRHCMFGGAVVSPAICRSATKSTITGYSVDDAIPSLARGYTPAAFRRGGGRLAADRSAPQTDRLLGRAPRGAGTANRTSGARMRGAKMMTESIQLDIVKILERLPHRYPFLLVDRVLECRPGESIRALKNVTYNEPFFPGHFPARPVMPGVMIIEALAQTAGILAFVTAGIMPDDTTRFYFVGIDKARFQKARRAGRPADADRAARAQLQGHLALLHRRSRRRG